MRKVVKETLVCPKCKKAHLYTSDEVANNILICKSCGADIKVSVYIDAVDSDYARTQKGQVVRRHPKEHISKKERKRRRKV